MLQVTLKTEARFKISVPLTSLAAHHLSGSITFQVKLRRPLLGNLESLTGTATPVVLELDCNFSSCRAGLE